MSDRNSAISISFESSGGKAAVAVMRGGAVLAQRDHVASHGHAAWIVTLAEAALNDAGIKAADCDVILAGRGPGSFTGIRVALAAAKGFGLATGLPAYGLSSLEAMALAAGDGRHPVAALADSRRGSVFLELQSSTGSKLAPTADLPPEAVIPQLLEFGRSWIITGHVGLVDDLKGAQADIDLIAAMPAEPEAVFLPLLYARANPASRSELRLEPLYLSPPLLGASPA